MGTNREARPKNVSNAINVGEAISRERPRKQKERPLKKTLKATQDSRNTRKRKIKE